MSENEKPDLFYKVINDLDKSLRIIAPGFLLLVVIFWETDLQQTLIKLNKINILLIVFSSIAIGVVFYALHRSLFSIIDFFAIKKKKEKFMDAAVNSFKTEHSTSLQKTFYIFNASLHLSSMFYEIMIISFFLGIFPISLGLLVIFLVLLLLSILLKIFVTRLEHNIKCSAKNNDA